MKIKKVLFTTLMVCSLALAGCSKPSNTDTKKEIEKDVPKNKTVINEVDYGSSFDGINGCAIFFNPTQNVYDLHNGDLCEEEISPYSTFKIITTLMGLSKGVVASEDSTLGYDGTIYSRSEWNKDVTLKEAFQSSCVWYYKKMMDNLDKDYVQGVLDDLSYGNADISAWDENSHNGFWLSSSLKISPKNQVEVLSSIFEGKTNFDKSDTDLLKKFMLVESKDGYSVYGKTGSASKQNAWFVGFLEKDEKRTYFAVRLDDASQEMAGAVAKKIALDIIDKHYAN